jgi:hypothetical protein
LKTKQCLKLLKGQQREVEVRIWVHLGPKPTLRRGVARACSHSRHCRWVRRALRLFDNHPRLAMLGGFRGRMDVGNQFDKGTGQVRQTALHVE